LAHLSSDADHAARLQEIQILKIRSASKFHSPVYDSAMFPSILAHFSVSSKGNYINEKKRKLYMNEIFYNQEENIIM
jgi:hypothetical protein